MSKSINIFNIGLELSDNSYVIEESEENRMKVTNFIFYLTLDKYSIVFITESGVSEILSIFSLTKNRAKSG